MKVHRFLLASALCITASSCAAPSRSRDDVAVTPRPVAPPPSPPASPRAPEPAEAEPDPFPVLHGEAIGPFVIGLAKQETLRLAPQLRQSGPVIDEGATGEWVEVWEDPSAGLRVAFSSTDEDGPKSLRSVGITAPSRLVTKRGVGLGASQASVLAEYGDALDRDFPPTPTTIIAGSLYGGMIFEFERGALTSIFLGAGAE